MLPDPVAIETATDFSRAGVPGKGSCDTQHKWDRQDNSPHPQHSAHGIFLLSLHPSCSSRRPLLTPHSITLTSGGVLIPAAANPQLLDCYLFIGSASLALRPRGGAFSPEAALGCAPAGVGAGRSRVGKVLPPALTDRTFPPFSDISADFLGSDISPFPVLPPCLHTLPPSRLSSFLPSSSSSSSSSLSLLLLSQVRGNDRCHGN